VTSSNALKQSLVDAYGGFADKRIKKLESGSLFHVDGRSAGDYDARKQLFLWFCTVTVTVKSGEEIIVHVGSAIPKNAAVEQWLSANQVPGQYDRMGIVIKKGQQAKVLELAELVASVIKKPYSVKAYKYVAPSTASALTHLKKVLDKAWAA
jgi:hypothetical protein